MQLSEIKSLMPDSCKLQLSLNMNNEYVTVELNDNDLALSDKDFTARILNPVIQTLIRVAKNA